MRLDGILANKKLLRDLAVAQAAGNQGENLVFPGRYPHRLDALRVHRERLRVADDHDFFCASELEPQPDAKCGKHGRYESAVDLE